MSVHWEAPLGTYEEFFYDPDFTIVLDTTSQQNSEVRIVIYIYMSRDLT